MGRGMDTALFEQAPVLSPSLHGVDEQPITAAEPQHDKLQEPAGGIELQPQLPLGMVLTQGAGLDPVLGCMSGVFSTDPVLER